MNDTVNIIHGYIPFSRPVGLFENEDYDYFLNLDEKKFETKNNIYEYLKTTKSKKYETTGFLSQTEPVQIIQVIKI